MNPDKPVVYVAVCNDPDVEFPFSASGGRPSSQYQPARTPHPPCTSDTQPEKSEEEIPGPPIDQTQ